MKQILISVLDKESDVISVSHYITSLKAKHPISEIKILTLKKHAHLVKVLNYVDEVFSLDQDDISSTLKNPIYSDAFALNSFFDSITACMETQWDIFCNFSNDLTSSYLASIFDAKETFGTMIAPTGNPLTHNIWASYQNFAMPKQNKHILNRQLIRHQMSEIEHIHSYKRLKSDPSLDRTAKSNFDKIRFHNSISSKKIIAINVEHSYSGLIFKEDMLCSLIEDINLDESVCPVILTQGTAKEINLINAINKRFDNSIVSINAKSEALPSVLRNIDLLVSLENNTLIMSDALNIKTIEVKDKSFSQASYLLNNGYAIYANEVNSVKNDLAFIINQELETTLSVNKVNSPNKTYAIVYDDYSLLETQINGPVDIEEELNYHLTRYYHFQLLGKTRSTQLTNHLRNAVDNKILTDYLFKVKEEIDNSLKTVLGSIRNAPMANNSKVHSQNFLNNLDQINERALANTITSAPFCIFEAKLENLPSGDKDGNLRAIEVCLYELKDDLQMLITIVEDMLKPQKRMDQSIEI